MLQHLSRTASCSQMAATATSPMPRPTVPTDECIRRVAVALDTRCVRRAIDRIKGMCNEGQGKACGSASGRSGKRPRTLRRQWSVFPSIYAQPPLVAEEAATVQAFMEEAARVEHPAAAESSQTCLQTPLRP